MTGDGPGGVTGHRGTELSRWLLVAGAVLLVASLVPPLSTLARRNLVAETVQFSMFAMICPALIVLGTPWRILRLSSWADRLAARRDRQRSFRHAGVFLAAFVLVALAWRLPPALDAVARVPGLVAAEAVTLLAAGAGLWVELVRSPPLAPRLPLPQRAILAALAMWSVWITAYALGFSTGPVVDAYAGGSGLGVVADQEIAVGLVWGVAGVCFVPVIFHALISWLKEGSDVGEESRQAFPGSSTRTGVRGWDRPQRR
jgi:cytochrome c oxidase assembly factor CtaG